jgi:hypothetical protein
MGARTLIAIVLAAVVGACSGPHATATDARVHPSARPGFYRVDLRLVNSGGRGQVELTVRLRNTASGSVVTQEQPVDLERRDRTDVAIEIPAPPGDYTVEVTVNYPPG